MAAPDAPPEAIEATGSDADAKLMNLIAETAQKSSYNNSRRRGLAPPGEPRAASQSASQAPKKRGGCCGGAGDVAAGSREPDGDSVLRDPTSRVSYNVLHLVGEGGFSKVLLVRAKSGHVGGKDVYAAKIIPKAHLKSAGESFIKATMLERNILGEFDHPFLLKLYHSFQEKDKLVLVVDYCPGGSLHTHVNISLREAGSGFTEQRAAFYVSEVALGVAHLHSRGIVHRDLKLENVLMHASGHCAVSDFGASKRLAPVSMRLCRAGGQAVPNPPKLEPSKSLIKTETKSIVGTPAYMAPEMLLAQPYGFSVDWWALGVLFFTMLKGRLPFDAANEDKMLWRIVKSKPRYDAAWSGDVIAVLRALLQKRPATRLSDLRTLANAPLYHGTDWVKLEAGALRPPYVPSLSNDHDQKYVPKRICDAPAFPLQQDYKKGASMRKLFKGFSNRSSFGAADSDAPPGVVAHPNLPAL